MKRVLLVSSGDPTDKRQWSGTEYSFYQQLTKYYDVDILTINIPWAKIIDKLRMKVMTLGRQHTGFGLLNSYCCSKKVERKLMTGDYDAAFVFGCTNIPFLNATTPVVYYTDATTHVMQHYYWDFIWPLSWEADLIQGRCLKKSSINLVASTWALNDMVNYFGIEKDKCVLCRLGANVEWNENLPVKKNKAEVNIVFVGADWNRKGGDIAVETYRLLKATNSSRNFRLHVVGSKPTKEIQDDGIIFYGFLDRNKPDQEILHSKIFKDGDIFLLPTHAECAGIVFCEASAYGLPIITYDTGGIGDYVINGINGFRLPTEATANQFAMKILEIIDSPSLLSKLSQGGRRLFVESLNWNAAGGIVETVIESLTTAKL